MGNLAHQFQVIARSAQWGKLAIFICSTLFVQMSRGDVNKNAAELKTLTMSRQQAFENLHQAQSDRLNMTRQKEAEELEELNLHRKDLLESSLDSLQKLKNSKITGLEFIEAGPGSSAAQGRWGHALLRFVDSDGDDFNDVVVGFIADVSDPVISGRKGIFGGYKATLEVSSMAKYLQFYNHDEGRSLVRWIIPADQRRISQLILTLERFLKDRAFAGDYYFVNRNCAVLLQTILGIAGFPEISSQTIIPTNVGSVITKEALSILPPTEMLNVPSLITSLMGMLQMKPSIDSLKKISRDMFLSHKSRIDDLTLLRSFFLLKKNLAPEVVEEIFHELESRHLRVNLAEVYDLKALDASMYALCTSSDCLVQMAQKALYFWPMTQLKEHCRSINGFWDPIYLAESKGSAREYRDQARVFRNILCSSVSN